MSSVTKVLIIGAGEIGSRHLQGILKSNRKLSITIVDPNLESLQKSKIRAEEIKYRNLYTTINYRQMIPKNESFKICIISTNSDVRAKVTKELLANCFVKHIIFEKILFQKELDYKFISNLLKKNNTMAWVNCPRRTFFIYQEIKNTLDTENIIEMIVDGSSWDLASNSIHFIDLFSFFTNSSNFKITKSNFSNNIFNNKRGKDYYAVSGKIECRIDNHYLTISCDENKKPNLFVKINNKKIDHYVDEFRGRYKCNLNRLVETQDIFFPYQSNTSAKLIDSLVDRNQCELTSFADSCNHHLPLIVEIRRHLSKILNKDLSECPIT
jgi:hypothetical protein